MTTIQLKKILVNRITEINDISFLNAIKTILESRTETDVLMLNEAQRDEIMESKGQITKGLFMEQAAIDKEFAKWAKAK